MKQNYLNKFFISLIILLMTNSLLYGYNLESFHNNEVLDNCNSIQNLVGTSQGDVVTLIWEAPLDGNVVLSENFDGGEIPSTWTNIDADGDGNVWMIYDTGIGDVGYAATSHSFMPSVGGLSPDNYLITPELNLTNGGVLNYWVRTMSTSFPDDHYGIFVSTTGNNLEDFGDDPIFEETLTAKAAGEWYERTIELPEGTKYVAFRHFNCTNVFRINIDDVLITSNSKNKDNYLFNVYREGQLLGSTTDLNFVEEGVDVGIHNYCVEVVCSESSVSELVCVDVQVNTNPCDPVQNLEVELNDDVVTLTWEAPQSDKSINENKKSKVIITKERSRDITEGYCKVELGADDVWEDGTGYQMLLDADHNVEELFSAESLFYGGVPPEDLYSSNFEYTIPTDAEPSCSTTAVIAGGSQEIEIPEGIYDWCIVNPAPLFGSCCIYYVGNEGNFPLTVQDDFKFERGYKYLFYVSYFETGDGVDTTFTQYESFLSYNIFKDNELIATTEDLTYTDNNVSEGTHKYCVQVVCSENSVSNKECVEVDITNIKDSKYSTLSVYPNPSNNIVNIDGVDIDKIYIYNNIGKLVEISNTNQINVSSYNSGVYILNVIATNGTIYKSKVVVQ